MNSDLCFLYMGGVYQEKGVMQAASAYRLLPTTIQERCKLHVFGNGDKQLMDKLAAVPGVFIHNSLPPARLRQFAAENRCCGLVLYNEHPRYKLIGTNSRKLYEYLALGMPVICTSVGELPQFLNEHEVGLLISSQIEIEELTASMLKFAESNGFWDELSERARHLMNMPEMTWEHEWGKVASSGVLDELRRAA